MRGVLLVGDRRRAVARNRSNVLKRSTAPRYVSLATFAQMQYLDRQQMSRWLHNGPVWVPEPDIVLGARRRPGWSVECAEGWEMGMPRYDRPEPVMYLERAQILRQLAISAELLWAGIAEGSLSMPAIWRDDEPGWAEC